MPKCFELKDQCLLLSGDLKWTDINSKDFNALLQSKEVIKTIHGTQIVSLDTVGAYFIQKTRLKFNAKLLNFSQEHENVMALVAKNYKPVDQKAKRRISPIEKVYQIGESTTNYVDETKNLIAFFGALCIHFYGFIKKPFSACWALLMDIIVQTGIKSIGIVCLLCFLIGVVLCYQIGSQLKLYGANIFVVDLLGISLLREFAPLITAIIIAGRSGSAFTAEIGSMKVNAEIDAMRTMGISPIQRLVIPRVVGLLISLPLLIVLADIASVFGGMLMAEAYLNISPSEFLDRFATAVPVNNYLIGLFKAPFFALTIAAVGCYRGLSVKNNSLSIGQETTKSVVYSIFLIIILDAAFSILFSAVGV